jgi:tryptophan halogenase
MALQEDRDINRITIVGGGTSGYLAAFYFAKNYPNKHITWIFPEVNDTIGVGEALVPKSSHFLRDIGIDHTNILKFCNGTLKLGIVFDGFNRPGEKFSFPFGIGEGSKHNTASIDRIINTERIPSNILDYPDIATHFRTTELAEYLDTRVCEFANLTVIRDTVTKESIAGTYDLLIDSTGFDRHVSKLPNNFEDFSHIIPNNRALTTRIKYTNRAKQCKPYSLFKAMDCGWCWHIPLGDRLAFGYVHDNNFDVREEFTKHVAEYMEMSAKDVEVNIVNFVTGRNKIHLKDNVVPIGLASTFIEPLESTGIYLIVSSIEKIGQYIDGAITEDEYNQQVNNNFDAIVNFIAAHYKYSSRDNEYWNYFKDLKIEQYKETDIFPIEAWQYILSGFDLAEAPKENIDPHELINIHKGTPYHEWIQDESNFT